MSEVKDQLQHKFASLTKSIRVKIFGHNNERLDFLLDSFYKLTPTQRNGVVAIGISVLSIFILLAVSLYFSRVHALEKELSDSFSALRELKRYKIEYQLEEKRFSKLLDTIRSKTKDVNFKPYFEKLSREKNVQIKDISEKNSDMDPNNPLSEKMKEVHVEMRLPSVSIPRLLDFIIEIEKSGHYMRVQDLKISGTYGNKFFFDTTLLIRGYSMN